MDDLVDALIIAATESEAIGEVYNLGAPDPMSLSETAKIMCHGIKGASWNLSSIPEGQESNRCGRFHL